MNGTVTNVTVTLKNLSHTWVSDVDALLVGPGGQKVLVFSNVGVAFNATNVTVTLSDAAASALPASGSFASGTYQPTAYPPAITFPGPAPAGPYAAALSAFNGAAPNGTWSLYVFDDGPGDQGSFAGGWSLAVTTVAPTGSPAPTGTPTPTATATPTIPPTPTPTPFTGLVAAYNFNEGSGTTVIDASGHGITGTVHGTAWTTGGRYGNALSFNGSSGYVDLGNPALLQITGSTTWSAWVKAAANPANDGQIIAQSNSSFGSQFKTSRDTGPHTFGVSVSG